MVIVMALIATAAAYAQPSLNARGASLLFATLGVRVTKSVIKVRLEIFHDRGSIREAQAMLQATPADVEWDNWRMPVELTGRDAPLLQRRHYECSRSLPNGIEVGGHELVVSDLMCRGQAELSVAILSGEQTRIAGVSPAPAAMQVSQIASGGERMLLWYRPCPAGIVINFEREKKTRSAEVADRAIQYGVPVVTALLILMLSTLVQRWLLLRGSEQECKQVLEVYMMRIEKRPQDTDLRQRFLDYILSLRERSEYGGFAPKFTQPLDAIYNYGNIDDVSLYRSRIVAMKMGVKLSWIFFVRRGGGGH